MSNIVTMQYGSYSFSPVPIMNLSKQYQKTPDGYIIGSVFNATLEGTLYAPIGGITSVIQMQQVLRQAFATQGQLFVLACNSGELIQCYPRINGPEFLPTQDNWVQTCKYTISLQFDDEPQPSGTSSASIGENSAIMPPFISDASESWNLEQIEDSSHYLLNLGSSNYDSNPYQFRITHNVSAVGKLRYTGSGLNMPAWQQARTYVLGKLSDGYNNTILASSGVLNIDYTQFTGFNHLRTNTVDETGGSFAVTESWIAINPGATGLAGNAIEDFTADVRKTIESDISTINIQGTITGLESRTYGVNPGDYSISTSKYNNASGYWNNIKDSMKIFPRAQLFANTVGTTRPLNTVAVNRTIGHNPAHGVITYSYEYNDRPSNCVPNSLIENVDVIDNNPTDVFAEIGIPGRSAGPILQDMGTITSAKRELNIEIVMPPATGCPVSTNIDGTSFYSNPSSEAYTYWVQPFLTDLQNNHTQVFKYIDTENWSIKTGRYSRSIGWVYQQGC